MLAMRIAVLFCMSCSLSLAESWSGSLVDAKCYEAMERNVNPTDTMTAVDRDQNMQIRYCAPKPKTRLFAMVPQEGPSLRLDSAGNAEATQLVHQSGKKSRILVTVTGEQTNNTVRVETIVVTYSR